MEKSRDADYDEKQAEISRLKKEEYLDSLPDKVFLISFQEIIDCSIKITAKMKEEARDKFDSGDYDEDKVQRDRAQLCEDNDIEVEEWE